MEIRIVKGEKGFTLIELLVVLFICSLALLPALYNWQQQQQKLRLIDAARQVTVFIYRHLMESVYLNRHRILSIALSQGEWTLSIKEAGARKSIAALASTQFEGIEIKTASRLSVDFYGKQGTSHSFRLELKNDFGQITVFMSAMGRIRVCSNDKLTGIPRC